MTVLEGDGVRALERDMRLFGLVYRANGETFEQFCTRIAGEYYLTRETARRELERWQ